MIAAAILLICFGVGMSVQMVDAILHQHAVLNPNKISTTIFFGLFIVGFTLPITILGTVWAIWAILGKTKVVRIDENGITHGTQTYPWKDVSRFGCEGEKLLWKTRIMPQFYSVRRRSWITLRFDRRLTKKEYRELVEKLEAYFDEVNLNVVI